MGQRSAVVLFVLGGGLAIPIALFGSVAAFLGHAAVPTSFTLLSLGFGCLVAAKWPVLRRAAFISFGPADLSRNRRSLYFVAYALLASGLLLALLSPLGGGSP
jgi:hypothetical protein